MSKNTVVKGGGFCHIALGAIDFDKTIAFYGALGMPVVRSWGGEGSRAAMLDMGDGGIIEVYENAPNTEEVAPNWQHLAIATTDTDGAYEAALAAGATVKVEPKDVVIPCNEGGYPVRIAFVYGPSGEVIEFFCEK